MKVGDPYFRDVLDQPTALRTTIDFYRSAHGQSLLAGATETLRRGPHHLWLSGMGASLFSCFAARHLLEDSPFTHRVEETSYLAEQGYAGRHKPGGLLIVSQSGETVEAVRLLTAQDFAIPTVAVTREESSYLANHVDAVLPLAIDADHSVAVKTYVASTAVLLMLFNELSGGSAPALHTALDRGIDAIEDMLGEPDSVPEAVTAAVGSAQSLYALGRGSSYASALESGLLIKETAKQGCEGLTSAQFRHGAVEVVEQGTCCIIFSGSDETTLGFHQRLIEEIETYGGTAIVVGPETSLRQVGGIHWPVPDVPAEAVPLVEIVPIQLLARRLATNGGVEPGAFRNTAPVITVE